MTDYVRRNLHPGETVDCVSRVSWVAALGSGVIRLIFSFVLFLVGQLGKLQDMKLQDILASITRRTAVSAAHQPAWTSLTVGSVLGWLALAVCIFAIVSLVRGLIFRATAEYAVTDQRVIGKYGLIDQQAIDIRISAITGVTTSNTLPGRIFGYGTVWVNAAGTRDQLVAMNDPKTFQTAVYSRINTAGGAANTPDGWGASALQPQAAPGLAMRFCPSCGSVLGQGARFCPGCGSAVE